MIYGLLGCINWQFALFEFVLFQDVHIAELKQIPIHSTIRFNDDNFLLGGKECCYRINNFLVELNCQCINDLVDLVKFDIHFSRLGKIFLSPIRF